MSYVWHVSLLMQVRSSQGYPATALMSCDEHIQACFDHFLCLDRTKGHLKKPQCSALSKKGISSLLSLLKKMIGIGDTSIWIIYVV